MAFRKRVYKELLRSRLIPCLSSQYDWKDVTNSETDHEADENTEKGDDFIRRASDRESPALTNDI